MVGFRALVLMGILVIAAAVSRSSAQQGTEIARPRMIAESTAIVPGEINWIAVTWDIKKGWHTYWPGQNSTNFTQVFEITGPEGFEIGKAIWPGPKRHEPTEGLLDHVYEKQATVIVPIKAPSDLPVGSKVTFLANLEYLVCDALCIPGFAELTLELPVARERTPSRDSALIKQARERAPKPWPKGETPMRARWEGDSVRFDVPGATKLAFMPGAKSVVPEELIAEGEVEGERLVVRFEPKPGRATGLLAVTRKDVQYPEYFVVDLQRPDSK